MRRWSLCALFVLALPALALADPPDPSVRSATSTGGHGVRESVRGIMLRQAVLNAEGIRLLVDHEKKAKDPAPDRGLLPPNPLSPDVAQTPAPGFESRSTTGGAELQAAQTVGLNFTGAALTGPYWTSSIPPDPMGAVGPTQFVVFVNGRLVSYHKSTGTPDGVLNVDPNVFFGPVRNGYRQSDPRIRYDRLTGRWFLLNINVSTPNRILIAVSDAASQGVLSAATVFTFFYIDVKNTPPVMTSDCLGDYPTLGIDRHALYVGTNNFCPGFTGCDGYVIRKSSILGAGPLVVTVFRGLVPSPTSPGPWTPQGVDQYSTTSNEGYFIGADNATSGTLMLRRVSDPGGTPTISANIPITVPATRQPILVEHLGNTGGIYGRLSVLDDRLFAAHLRDGRLWTAHSVGVNNNGTTSGTQTRTGSRWYELDVPAGSGTPVVVQSGTVFAPSGSNSTDQPSFWFPSIMVSGQGHAAMSVSTAGAAEYANAAVVGRLAGDAGGTMQAPVKVTSSATAYNPPGDPGSSRGRRWGDYSYVSLDPLDDMTMWAIHQFCDGTNTYGVRVTQLKAPPPATPAAIGDVTAGESAVTVTLNGTTVAGSGFYDPGADPPGGLPAFRHLAAAVTRGDASGTPPQVVSATWLTPTSVRLVLDASAATPSAGDERYIVSVTNPDGQTSSAAILRVLPGASRVSVADASVAEGTSGATSLAFTVSVSPPAAQPLTIAWTAEGVTAQAGSDYGTASGTLNLAAGATSGSIVVPVIADSCGEPSETLTVRLAAPSGAALEDSLATGTIANDDDAVPPAAAVLAPNGGETLPAGTSATLRWSATDAGGVVSAVDVLLSRDGGANFTEVLASGVANSGELAWTVTGPGTAGAVVRVVAHDGGCNTAADVSDAPFTITEASTDVAGGPAVTSFALAAVRPNPTRGAVQLDYQLPREARVRLTVVDVQGREVAVLATGRLAPGRYTATWTGRTAAGAVPRGAYFARFEADGKTWSRRFVVVR